MLFNILNRKERWWKSGQLLTINTIQIINLNNFFFYTKTYICVLYLLSVGNCDDCYLLTFQLCLQYIMNISGRPKV